MSPLVTIAGASFVLGFSGACMPGPLLTVTVSETARRGPWAGPLLIAGHALLEIVVVALVVAGFGTLITRRLVFVVIALVGAVLLFWLSYGMWRSLPSLTLQVDTGGSSPGGMHPLVSGALVSLANPYFTLWWATVGISYLVVALQSGWQGVVVFYLFHILADLAWYAFIAFSVHFGRGLLSDRSYRVMVGFCAIFLAGFACYFVIAGLTRLLGDA